jgi:ribonuclease Z
VNERRDVAFVTDTTARPETASFAKGVAALVHDARLDEESADGPDRGSHATATGAAMVARDAEAGTLVLAHLDPSFDEARLERMRFEACKVFPKTHLANDFATFELKTIESDDGAAESRAPAETAAED